MNPAVTFSPVQSSRRRYFGDAKPALLELFDPRGMRILDLGCGGGHNGELLKHAGARWVGGAERDAGACAEARRRLDAVAQCDLTEFDPETFGPEPFDAILASDVLEHLLEPEAVLGRALAHLRPGGLVVVSIPNVAHVYVFANLLLKRWPRKTSGIFDHTHVRFFAKRDMVALLEGGGLRVLRVEPYYTRYRLIRAACLVASLYVFRDYWARQFLLLAEKPG
jgi:2-polyprenyl-3-methyl-5-hydroxy-6-metoxy-1,4-benzoquinol methylase